MVRIVTPQQLAVEHALGHAGNAVVAIHGITDCP